MILIEKLVPLFIATIVFSAALGVLSSGAWFVLAALALLLFALGAWQDGKRHAGGGFN